MARVNSMYILLYSNEVKYEINDFNGNTVVDRVLANQGSFYTVDAGGSYLLNNDFIFSNFSDVAVVYVAEYGCSFNWSNANFNSILDYHIIYFDTSAIASFFGISSSGGVSATVDLNPVYTAINNAVDLIGSFISNKGDEVMRNMPRIDTSAIQSNLDLIKGYTDSLESGLSSIETRLSSSNIVNSSVISLNGDYGSYKDDSIVTCYPNNHEYKVSRSYLAFATGTSLTVIYDLLDTDGKKHIAPHEALTLKA